MSVAAVKLWGSTIGAVALTEGQTYATFQYDPAFARSAIQVAPLTMPLSERIYTFPNLPHNTFHGLPGMLADALPDRFGNDVIHAWLATQGRTPDTFDALERLCYTGTRAMGALEFEPTNGPGPNVGQPLDVAALVELATAVLRGRQDYQASFANADRAHALADLLRVGTSAGGARPKALIAWNETTNEVRAGQIQAGTDFGYWLLKLDGIPGDTDKGATHGQGYGAIEYAYALMASEAGINMTECRIFEEGDRRHFMTRRFDRLADGEKLHVQTLGAMAHLDFNEPTANTYEQAFLVMRQLGLPPEQIEQFFRRMLFNVAARNQDDHVKNVAFTMDKQGSWALAPAYDVTYAYDPTNKWLARHQMAIQGKRDAFTLADFKACGKAALLKRGRAEAVLAEVLDVIRRWPNFAAKAGVSEAWSEQIYANLRLEIPNS